MNNTELKTVLDAEIQDALGYYGSEVADERSEAMEYYLGENLGNEIEGRSQVVTRDVMDTIEWILPDLIRIFTGTTEAVSFHPVGPGDEEQAERETRYVNHVFYEDNNGFLILYSWFKDALLSKNGIVKRYWEESEERTVEEYENLTEVQLALILQDDELNVIEQETEVQEIDGEPVTLYSIKCERIKKTGQECIDVVAPEDFFISRKARSPIPSEAMFCAHRSRYTASDLIEMGYDQDLVDSLPSYTEDFNEEELARRNLSDEQYFDGNESINRAAREIEIFECYLRVDYDGDGIAELRKVLYAGQGGEILENEEVPDIPFHSITPVILTHKFLGLSVADLVKDLQKIKSEILRSILDNFYHINNAEKVVNENANLQDMLVSRPGGIKRVAGEGDVRAAIAPLQVQPLGGDGFTLMEYIDGLRKDRTGVDDNVMGLDPKTLQNAHVGAVTASMNAARQKVELIARIFAEVGVKDLFKGIHADLLRYQDHERKIKIDGEWVLVDPREWINRDKLTVNVGLGTGDRTQQMMAAKAVLDTQKEVIEQGGYGRLVLDKHIFKSLKNFTEAAGFKDVQSYWLDPESEEAQMLAQQQAMQPDQPNPLAEVEQIKGQFQLQSQQMKQEFEGQAKMMKMQSDMQIASLKEQHKHEMESLRMSLDAEQKERDRQSREAIEAAKLEVQAFIEGMKVDLGQPGIGAGLQDDA